MGIRVTVSGGAPEGWSAFVRAHPGSTFFHQHAWLPLVQHVYGCVPYHRAACDGEEIVGIPLLGLHRAIGAGQRLMCVPFSDERSPYADAADAEPALAERAERPVSTTWVPPRHNVTDDKVRPAVDPLREVVDR